MCHRWRRPHEGVMVVGNLADIAACRQFSQPFNREDDVEILLKSRAIKVGGDVAHDQIIHIRVVGDDPVFADTWGEFFVFAAMWGSALILNSQSG